MMFDTANPIKQVDGAVRVTGDDGRFLASFTGHDLQAWRQFQVDMVKRFNVVVTDTSMPDEISRTIKGPNSRTEKFVPSG